VAGCYFCGDDLATFLCAPQEKGWFPAKHGSAIMINIKSLHLRFIAKIFAKLAAKSRAAKY
jgi:hypothetical protein